VNREECDDEGQRPAAIDWRACLLARRDLGRDSYGFRLIRKPEFGEDALIRFARGVDRGHHDVPGDAENPQRAGNGDDPLQQPATREHDQQGDGGVGERGEDAERSVGLVLTAKSRDRVSHGIQRKPAGHEEGQSPGGDIRRVDEEERHRHADDRADGGLSARGRRRSSQRVQHLDARGERQQSANTSRRKLGPCERRYEGQRAKRQRDHPQAADDGLSTRSKNGGAHGLRACDPAVTTDAVVGTVTELIASPGFSHVDSESSEFFSPPSRHASAPPVS
jgi:hypothetical protein